MLLTLLSLALSILLTQLDLSKLKEALERFEILLSIISAIIELLT